MKKILIFSLAYHPHVGGAEIALREITERVFDIDFHLITMRFSAEDAPEEKMGKMHVHRVGKGGGYFSKILFIPRAAALAARLHSSERFDGVWAMMSYMLLPVVLMRMRGVRLPYALTLQEGDTYQHMFVRLRILPFLPLLNHGFRNATVVQTISTYLGEWARKRGFVGPLEVIPNGVDVQRFVGGKELHSGTVLITTSRLVYKNAVDDIIRALVDLPADVRLVVAGTGSEEASLKALANSLGVAERVRWLGYVDHARLPALLHAADIFVRPSRSEGMGNSFIEAMAAGLPVVATQEGGLKDFISAKTAWVVEKDTPSQIALQIKDILGNRTHTEEVIEHARQLVAEKYDWELIARAMQERVFSRLFS